MCRIALIHNGSPEVANQILKLQANGGNRTGKTWEIGRARVCFNRFDVTSSNLGNDLVPIRGSRYEMAYNGEVFGWKDKEFISSRFKSDIQFAIDILDNVGFEAFCESVDLQGTFIIRDIATDDAYLLTDQLNTCGAFYSLYQDTFIFCQELAIAQEVLTMIGAPADVPIYILPNGHFIRIPTSERRCDPKPYPFRQDASRVFEGRTFGVKNFKQSVSALKSQLKKATLRRIPRSGPVAVLCGGGVDSAAILAIVARSLKKAGEIERLRVFTFGLANLDVPEEGNDLFNTRILLKSLGISERHLIEIGEDEEARSLLYQAEVFSKTPRLITPNPILNTQIRHAIRMSIILASVVRSNSDIRVVLTGDVADELFAGYHSMRVGIRSALELAVRVREKLQDLPLNDAARFTLASLYGVSAIIRRDEITPLLDSLGLERFDVKGASQEDISGALDAAGLMTPQIEEALSRFHPIEVRTPFSSHEILRRLNDVSASYLVGEFDGRIVSKFLLRVTAHSLGVVSSIAVRKKMPFNEGGSGVRNDERDRVEKRCAENWSDFSTAKARSLLSGSDGRALRRLSLVPDEEPTDPTTVVERHFEQLAAYCAAKQSGLKRLITGGSAFRSKMPDCIYSTSEPSGAFAPVRRIVYDSRKREISESES